MASFTKRMDTRNPIMSRGFWKLVLLGFLGVNLLGTVLLAQASMANYPGGEALRIFNSIIKDSQGETLSTPPFDLLTQDSEGGRKVTVHVDNHAAQTGASLFLHEYAPPNKFLELSCQVVYKKTENLVTRQEFEGFDWIITEDPGMFTRADGKSKSRWTVQASAEGLRGIELVSLGEQGVWRILKIPRVQRESKLWILKQEQKRD